MVIIEYDKRSLKCIFQNNSTDEFNTMKSFVDLMKKIIPSTQRTYNPENKCWFMDSLNIEIVRAATNHLNLSWERRL